MTNHTNNKAIQPNGTLERLFGGITAQIIDFLSIHHAWDYNITDIAQYSDVSPRHTKIVLDKLEKLGIIKKTRIIGNNHMYQYNSESRAANLISKFALDISFIEYEVKAEQKTVVAEDQREELLVSVPA